MPNSKPKKVLTLLDSKRIRTVSDLMVDLEEEIGQIKSGALKEGAARLVMTGRRLQMRAVEITIQAARLETSLRPYLAKRIALLPEKKGA